MSNKILSYKGLMADGAMERILLTTKKGEKGYRITKFQMMGDVRYDHGVVMKIYKDEQTGADSIIDFSDNRLLAAGYAANHENIIYPFTEQVIFDNEIFNQDIYITSKDIEGGVNCNYYLELEVIMLSETQATVATLKDIRNNA
jgi:hypothetical protein|tara:strand:- start:211 stop:642 length:432 start_codon:yes stop_codon:yes gene_type:complete